MSLTAVFTTGAFVRDADFWFAPLKKYLEPRGIVVRCVELASCGDEAPLGDLHSDAERIRRVIDETDAPIILGGHSYGGLVITEAAAGRGDKVKHLLYLSGIVNDKSIMDSDYVIPGETPVVQLPDAGIFRRTALSIGTTRIGMKMMRLPGGRQAAERILRGGTVGEGAGSDAFKSNELRRLSNTDIIEEGLRRVVRQDVSSFLQAPRGLAYKEIPSTYVLGSNDGEVGREQLLLQASRCTHLVQVPTNHFCHLDWPDLIADIVFDIARGLAFDVDEPAQATTPLRLSETVAAG